MAGDPLAFDPTKCTVDPVTQIPDGGLLTDTTVPDAPDAITDCQAVPIITLPRETPCPDLTVTSAVILQGTREDSSVITEPALSFTVTRGLCCEFDFDVRIEIPAFCPTINLGNAGYNVEVSNAFGYGYTGYYPINIASSYDGYAPEGYINLTIVKDPATCAFELDLGLDLTINCPAVSSSADKGKAIVVSTGTDGALPEGYLYVSVVKDPTNCAFDLDAELDFTFSCPAVSSKIDTGTAINVSTGTDGALPEGYLYLTVSKGAQDCTFDLDADLDLTFSCPAIASKIDTGTAINVSTGTDGALPTGYLYLTVSKGAQDCTFDLDGDLDFTFSCPAIASKIDTGTAINVSTGTDGALPEGYLYLTVSKGAQDCTFDLDADLDLTFSCPSLNTNTVEAPVAIYAAGSGSSYGYINTTITKTSDCNFEIDTELDLYLSTEGVQGYFGFQGYAGGPQGFQGFGFQGYQGFGFQGFQGFQGFGFQGYQGFGFQGFQGYQGFGFQGFQGYQGFGFQGYQGYQGFGSQGYQGYQGFGSQGYQGPYGFQGYQGFGSQGYQGPYGFQGYQGFGFQGYQGPYGFQGFQGFGFQGYQGFGFQGYQGPYGFQGYQALPLVLQGWTQNSQTDPGTSGKSDNGSSRDIGFFGTSFPFVGTTLYTPYPGRISHNTWEISNGLFASDLEVEAPCPLLFGTNDDPDGGTGEPIDFGFETTDWLVGYARINVTKVPDECAYNIDIGITSPAPKLIPADPLDPPLHLENIAYPIQEAPGAQGYINVTTGEYQAGYLAIAVQLFLPAGYAESTGAYGAQGSQGYTGYEGDYGPQGSQGYVGYDGIEGVQGSQGYIGYEGNYGPQGSQGYAGYEANYGAQGVQGYIGYEGNYGPQGSQGYTGYEADYGPQGSQGYTGYEADYGPQGSQGYTGYEGDYGPQGPQGYIGYEGDYGPQGPQGYTGYDAIEGAQGPQGYTGYEGDYGPQGSQGYTGYDAIEGAQGSQGYTGYDGFEGGYGPQGPAGYPGDVTGPQGPQGVPGYAGPEGDYGPQGSAGYAGDEGGYGPQGSAGYAGVAGSQGPQGPSGYDGIEGGYGPQGPAGYPGDVTGPQGPQGVPGYTGTAGGQGPQGSTGFTGSTGPYGSQGPTGYTGVIGSQGAQGYTGLPGSAGDCGGSNSLVITVVTGVSCVNNSIQVTTTQIAIPGGTVC